MKHSPYNPDESSKKDTANGTDEQGTSEFDLAEALGAERTSEEQETGDQEPGVHGSRPWMWIHDHPDFKGTAVPTGKRL